MPDEFNPLCIRCGSDNCKYWTDWQGRYENKAIWNCRSCGAFFMGEMVSQNNALYFMTESRIKWQFQLKRGIISFCTLYFVNIKPGPNDLKVNP